MILKNEFVELEDVLKLRKLGFKPICCAVYSKPHDMELLSILCEHWFTYHSKNKNLIGAPLYQQAFSWLHSKLETTGMMPLDLENRKKMLRHLIELVKKKKDEKNS